MKKIKKEVLRRQKLKKKTHLSESVCWVCKVILKKVFFSPNKGEENAKKEFDEKGLSGVYHTKWLEVYPLSAIARLGERQ